MPLHRAELLLQLLDLQPPMTILDLACGDGALTVELARSGAILVGIDSSEELLAAARARGAGADEVFETFEDTAAVVAALLS